MGTLESSVLDHFIDLISSTRDLERFRRNAASWQMNKHLPSM